MALFHYRFPNVNYHRADSLLSPFVSLGDVRRVQSCIKMLLKHGARLDSVGSEQSALQYACEVAMVECFELLCVLLRGSTHRSVSLTHVEALKMKYGPGGSGNTTPGGCKKTERRGRVARQLSDFTARAFKQKQNKVSARLKIGLKTY